MIFIYLYNFITSAINFPMAQRIGLGRLPGGRLPGAAPRGLLRGAGEGASGALSAGDPGGEPPGLARQDAHATNRIRGLWSMVH